LHREALKHSDIDPYLKDLDDANASRNGLTWNIYKLITSGFERAKSDLKSRAYPTSSGADWDEAAYLVDSKKSE
jgi:hypothetical protein